jgi:hypothetical protein
MATQFDFASLGNMFGGMPGAIPTGLDALLTEDQRKLLGRNAALSAAGALLQASGRSAVPISMGQALGSALQAGQQGYEKTRASSFQDLLLGAKLKEMQREAAGDESWKNLIGGKGQTTTALTPEQAALAAPTTVAGPAGPTMARAQLADQMPTPAPISTDPLAFLNPTQRALIGGMPRKEGLPEVLKIAQSQSEFGAPTPVVIDNKTVMVQYNKQGQSRIAQGVMPYEAQSPDIRAVEYISGRPLAGTGTAGIRDVGQYRQQIAPKTNTNVEVKMPGNQQFLAGVGTDVSKTLTDLTAGARSANETLTNIDRMLPALDKAIVGPGADYRTTMLRIGQQLNIAGADVNEQLANTRIVVQGLAQQELDAAAQMRGQGGLTEGERGILRRAAAGDQTLSAAEIKQALSTGQKTARYRLKEQEDYLQRASKLPGFEQFAPMYQVTPYGGGGGGGSNPLLDAVNRQLQLRSSGGPR